MDSVLDVVGVVAETLSWIGLGAGLLLAVAALFIRLYDGSWQPATIVLLEEDRGPIARWILEDGIHQRPLTPAEIAALGSAEVHRAYVSTRDPGWMRLHRTAAAVRVVPRLALIFLGVGALGWLVSLIQALIG
ncbi:hypothetical protein [Rothia halotolerans]|uniref:hypothetical protein n=1 Tax=Rothia halotolerans TaxID=405770 RepID=UPI00101C5817|nr:hypothetical protein [Rothia halotolerans]